MVRFVRILLLAAALALGTAAQASAFGQIDSINGFVGGWSDTTYKLNNPKSITRAPDGYYVADSSAKRIIKLDPDGRLVSWFPLSGNSPVAIEYASSSLYVLDNSTLRRFSLDGQQLWAAGNTGSDGPCKFKWAMDLAVDPKTDLIYVVDYQNHWISIWSEYGSCAISSWTKGLTGDSGAAQFAGPTSIAFADGGKEMLVADQGAGVVKVWVDTGPPTLIFNWNYLQTLGANDDSFNGTKNLSKISVDQPGAPGFTFRVFLSLYPYKNCVKGFDAQMTGGTLAGGFTHQLAYVGTIGSCDTSSIFGGTPEVIADGGSMLAADAENHRVVRLSGVPNAPTIDSTWGGDLSKDDYINQATSIAVTPSGESYVLDSRLGAAGKVRHYGANGRLIGAFGSFGTGPYYSDNPTSIARAPNGDILVSLPASHSIARFTAGGVALANVAVAALPDFNPGPLAVDANGVIFAIDRTSGGDKIVRLAPDGTLLQNFGTQVAAGGGNADTGDTYYHLTDIAVKPDGQTVYLSDWAVLKKFTFDSGSGTWTGHDAPPAYLEGSAAASRYSNPLYITWDPAAGELVTSDLAHGRILRISEQSNNWSVSSRYPAPPATNTIAGLAKTGIDSSGKIYAVTGGESVVRLGEAPSVAISAPTTGTQTTAASTALNFTSDDAMASCDRASGDSLPLAIGANTLTVTCTNPQGSGTASVAITRVAPGTLQGPSGPGSGAISLKLPKKLRLSRSNKLAFNVTCPSRCLVAAKVSAGRRSFRVKSRSLGGMATAQRVTLKLNKKTARGVRAKLKARKRVKLKVTVRASVGQDFKTASTRVVR